MTNYRTGCMPNTDFRYEEFEGLLASAYLTTKAKHGSDSSQVQEASRLIGILTETYKLQTPEDAIANPRSPESWAQPKELPSSFSVSGSAWRDFGIQSNSKEFGIIRELERLL